LTDAGPTRSEVIGNRAWFFLIWDSLQGPAMACGDMQVTCG
jgi:hypothetical protein